MNMIFKIISLECQILWRRIVFFFKTVRYNFHAWRLHRMIAKFKRQGKAAGLPSLDEYTDEQIAEGLRQLKRKKS